MAANQFTEVQKQQIVEAIKAAELNTSGEIRVHIENNCKEDVLDRAAAIFEKLGMHKTELRNGVLFYIAIKDHKFAIIGDAGINAKVTDDFWDEIKEKMLIHLKNNDVVTALTSGLSMSGNVLKKYFPYQADDVNELSDDISFGE